MKLSDIQKKINAYIKVAGDKEIEEIRISTDSINCALHPVGDMNMAWGDGKARIKFTD